MAAPISFQIIDDQTVIRAALAQLMTAEKRLRVITQTDAAVMNGHRAQPAREVALTGFRQPSGSSLNGSGQLNLNSSAVQILVLAADVGAVFGLGLNTAEGNVAQILSGYSRPAPVSAPGKPGVSKRELLVLAQVASGLSNKQIGRLLGISQKTVRNHLSRIFGKLGAGNRTEAVMNAVRLGLLNV